MKKILILIGPNLNLLGIREPEIYGYETLADIETMCRTEGQKLGFEIELRQSNYEGDLVTWIQEARTGYDGMIINAAAYTHTSIAIHDALRFLSVPIIEVHQSDPKKREPFRHISYIEPLAAKVIAGHGAKGYLMALEWLAHEA
ncbi:MAG: type II 3-dehydroquinate dehydratase [Rhodospirillales bacterium]|nr:type II 3-dehydroquinate dehydratase [Rhodospirillales bacterium]MCB9964637.1 type II 3-dehydroquinate dehydratase [Rhodospirillales bacterium]MCB9979927.1 type II 3-dehydroquinate dehydratase [Rhodospirillales bacterium]